jgi:peptide/nickel transport system substrate-binding protein
MTEFNASTSPEQAKAVIGKLQAFTWKQLSVLTLSQSKLYAAYTPRLKGYGDFYRVFWNSWLAS